MEKPVDGYGLRHVHEMAVVGNRQRSISRMGLQVVGGSIYRSPGSRSCCGLTRKEGDMTVLGAFLVAIGIFMLIVDQCRKRD